MSDRRFTVDTMNETPLQKSYDILIRRTFLGRL